ncbi:hypothetical protein [Nocardioides sp. MH1]|uniref:hypothetical protein n=1 Tax=Nocardioides sp. MH1 TaxID=3242490 RepID=UPI0035208715
MTRRSTPRLRVAPPTLEPDPVLLHQLSELSMSSTPSARTARHAGRRALAGAAAVAVIGGTTWVAGAAVGPGLGTRHAQQPTHTSSVASPGEAVVGTPQPDDATSAPGSPWSPGLPGTGPSASHRAHHSQGRHDGTPGRSADHGHPGNPHQEGRHDNGRHHGHAYGHAQTPPAHSDHSGGSHQGRHDNGRHRGQGNGQGNGQQQGHGHGKGHGQSNGHGHGKGHD